MKINPAKIIFVVLYSLKELLWRDKRSEERLHSETRVTSNVLITKTVREVGEASIDIEAEKKNRK